MRFPSRSCLPIILAFLLCGHCGKLSYTQNPNSSANGQYGSAEITVLYPSQEEQKKILNQGGSTSLFIVSIKGDTLFKKVWVLPDTIPSGFNTGPVPASDSACFILCILDTKDTITHIGYTKVALSSGANIKVSILALSRFGSIKVKMVLPADIKANIHHIEMVVEAKDFSPLICNLVISGDTAKGELTRVLAGDNRIVTLRVCDANNRLLYIGKDTLTLLPGHISNVNIQLQLSGIISSVDAQIGSDGSLNLIATFPGQTAVSTDTSMVFVPTGDFIYGLETEEVTIHSDSFWIDKYEVTNQSFAAFLKANPDSMHLYSDSMQIDTVGGIIEAIKGFQTHPVVYASWYAADAYCRWRGKKLPSDTLWEKAARGSDGRTFPWGETEPDSTFLNYNSKFNGTTPVDGGMFEKGKSVYGAYDMSGNVYEWCNTKDPDGTTKYIRKGGGWNSTKTYCMSAYTGKDYRTAKTKALGFRCAKY